MKIIGDWHCPDLLSGPGKYQRRAHEDAPLAIAQCKQRRVAIQAGGHIGTWPVFLSTHFGTVYTFEPAADNFACLMLNIWAHGERPESIFATRGVLGHKRGPIEMVLSGKSTGQHRVRYPSDAGMGTVPAYRIDDLALPIVDALFLDLEGYEMHALSGARDTLRRCRPVVMAENNKRVMDHGFKMESLEALMKGEGYRLHAAISEDLIFVHNGHV